MLIPMEDKNMKYDILAKEILSKVGGVSNVSSLAHCMTRLRFNLKDDSKADIDKVKQINGVVGCVNKGGQFQVIIGTHVEDVYLDICKIGGINTQGRNNQSEENKKGFGSLFDIIAGIFMPIIGALAGSGMIKAILAIGTAMNWISPESQTYTILFMISDIVFYYLPCFIAYSAAKKMKCSPFLALIFAGMLVHPDFVDLRTAGEAVYFFGIPVRMAIYSSSVIPIILIVFIQSYVERWAKKISPDAVKTFLVPLITIIIIAPLGLIVLGPIGSILGDYLANFFVFLDGKISWLVPTLVGGLSPLLVMTGMHYSIGAVQATQRATVGYGTIHSPGMMASNMAQAAAILAVSVKTKDKSLKTLATSCGITALCGITEPALYGITLKYKRPLYATMLAGAIAGFYAGITNVKAWSAGTSNIFSLPIYIGPDNSFINICITVVIALVLGFILSYLLHKDDMEFEESAKTDTPMSTSILDTKIEILSPLKGDVLALEEVNDEAFSSLAMGKGVAVNPEEGVVVAPFDGTIEMLFKTKHAIGIKSVDGIELLIHIGIDTVKLEGKYFETFVEMNDKVEKGQKLIEFDIEKIKAAGYQCVTPIIVTNTIDYLEVVEKSIDCVEREENLLTLLKGEQ